MSSYAALGREELLATALTAIEPLTPAPREYGGDGRHGEHCRAR